MHASIIHHQAGGTYLVDLGSCHGTFVDDVPLQARQPTLVVNGSVLKCVLFTLWVSLGC